MKYYSTLSRTLLVGLIIFTQNSFANEAEKREEECKIPKLLDFNLPEYTTVGKQEVAPEAEFSFRISGRGADAKQIKVKAKDKVLATEISENSSFIYVKGKLPAEFTGQYVRLHAFVGTEMGCIGKDGWLIKVAATNGTAANTTTEPAAPATPDVTPTKATEAPVAQ